MARPKKRGAAAGDREETTSLPTGRQPQHEDTVDEGIAATPDDTTLEAQVENEDSTYDSSPQKQTTPLQTPVRQNAATSTRSNRVFVDHSSSSFEAGHPSEAGGAPASVTQSKVVVLTVSPQKLRPLLESFAAPEKKVLLRVSPEKLRKLLQELLARDIVQGPAGQAEEPAEHRPAEMAPVKDQNPHDILDGKISAQDSTCGMYIDWEPARSFQRCDPELLRHWQHHSWLSAGVSWSIDQEEVSALFLFQRHISYSVALSGSPRTASQDVLLMNLMQTALTSPTLSPRSPTLPQTAPPTQQLQQSETSSSHPKSLTTLPMVAIRTSIPANSWKMSNAGIKYSMVRCRRSARSPRCTQEKLRVQCLKCRMIWID